MQGGRRGFEIRGRHTCCDRCSRSLACSAVGSLAVPVANFDDISLVRSLFGADVYGRTQKCSVEAHHPALRPGLRAHEHALYLEFPPLPFPRSSPLRLRVRRALGASTSGNTLNPYAFEAKVSFHACLPYLTALKGKKPRRTNESTGILFFMRCSRL